MARHAFRQALAAVGVSLCRCSDRSSRTRSAGSPRKSDASRGSCIRPSFATPAGQPVLDAAGLIQYNLGEGLLTRNAVSKSISGGQVLASIVMFSLIYVLLGWVWLYVLNDKIQKGPKPVVIGGDKGPGGWLKSAAGRTLHEESMSEAKEER